MCVCEQNKIGKGINKDLGTWLLIRRIHVKYMIYAMYSDYITSWSRRHVSHGSFLSMITLLLLTKQPPFTKHTVTHVETTHPKTLAVPWKMLSPKDNAKHSAPLLQLKKGDPKIDLDAKTHGIFMTFHVVTSWWVWLSVSRWILGFCWYYFNQGSIWKRATTASWAITLGQEGDTHLIYYPPWN